MSLAPRLSVTLGSKRYDSHVTRCRVELGVLPAVNVAELVFPRGVAIDAAPGDPASLDLDGGDGAGAATVMTGVVARLRRGPDATRVTISDGGGALARLRPAATYRQQTFATVIGRLAKDAGVDTGEIAGSGDAPAVIVHQGRTAAEWVAALAELDGTVAAVDGKGRLVVSKRADHPDSALRHGREPLTYSAGSCQAAADERLRVGFGAAGAIGAPDALVQSVEPVPSGDKPGAAVRWTPTPLLRTAKAAEAASTAASAAAAAAVTRLDATTILTPACRPGQVIEVQDLPGGIGGGPWLLLAVRHRIDSNGGAETRLEGVAAGGTHGGLLGAAAGAIGALL